MGRLQTIMSLLACCCVANVHAATGDLLSATVQTNVLNLTGGWYIGLKFEGMASGGTHDLGLSSTNTTEAAKLVLTLTSQGYDQRGNATTTMRTLYGTKQLRKPYPDDASELEIEDGSDVMVYYALSDYVYGEDTGLSLTLGAGLYTDGGNPSAAVIGYAVVNDSTLSYADAKVVGNFMTPQYQVVTDKHFIELRYEAQHQHGIAAIKFYATDGTTTNTYWIPDGPVSTLSWPNHATVNDYGDPVPVTEYFKAIPCQNLTNSYTVTTWAEIYPTVGNSSSVLNTGDGVYSEPTPFYTKQIWLFDPLNTYGYTWAIVNASTGNDGTGTVTDDGTYSENPFETIDGALAAIAAHNNSTFSRNDVSGGVVFLTDDAEHASFGGSSSYGDAPDFWVTIAAYPGDYPVISSASGNLSLGTAGDKLKVQGIAFTGSAELYDGNEHIWLDNCSVNLTGLTPFDENEIGYATRNHVIEFGNYGFGPQQEAKDAVWALVRGNTFSNFTGSVMLYRAVGNLKVGTKSSGPKFYTYRGSTQVIPNPDNVIFAHNYLPGNTGAAIVVETFDTVDCLHGAYFGWSLIEGTGDGVSPMFWCSADGSTNTVRNVMIRGLTCIGQRESLFYNDVGSDQKDIELVRVENCIMSVTASKTDTFPTENANRTGNWPMQWGVGYKNNIFPHTTGMSAAGQFSFEFPGLNSYQAATTSATSYLAFVDDQSWLGGSATTGFGNYRSTASSPHIGLVASSSARYDIEGHRADSTYSYPGAHSYHAEADTVFVSKLAGSSESGTFAAPYNTVQEGITAATTAGDTVKIGGGYYDEDTDSVADGSSGSPITLDGQGSASVGRVSYSHEYQTLLSTRLRSYDGQVGIVRVLIGANFLTLTNVVLDTAEDVGQRAIYFQAHTVDPWGDAASNWFFSNVEATRIRNQKVGDIFGFNGVITNFWIHDIVQGDGFYLNGSNIVVTSSVFTNNMESLNSSEGNHIDFLQINGVNGDGAADIMVRNCFFADSLHGLQLEPDGVDEIVRVSFENNIFYRIGGIGTVLIPYTSFRNNLWYECNNDSGGHVFSFGYDADGGFADHCTVENNAFVKCGNGDTSKGWYAYSTTLTSTYLTATTNRYNYVGIGSGYSAPDAGTAGPLDPGFDSFEFYEPGTGVTGGDPLFSDPDNLDFRLGAGSPLLGAGVDLSSLFTDDYNGDTRNTWDIGPLRGSGPIVWYQFEDDFEANGFVSDTSGNSAHALNYSTTNFPTRIASSIEGSYAAQFTPNYADEFFTDTAYWSGDYAVVTNIPSTLIGNTTELTVMGWAAASELPGGYNYSDAKAYSASILNGGWNVLGAWHFGRHESSTGGHIKFLVTTNTTSLGDSCKFEWPYPVGYDDTNWYHYAAVVTLTDSGSTVTGTLYTNGIAYSTNTYAMGAGDEVTAFNVGDPPSTPPPWIGMSVWTHNQGDPMLDPDRQPNTGWWDGMIDDVRVYDRAVSASEIATIAGAEYEPPADTTPPTLNSAVIPTSGATITLTFNEAVTVGAGGNGGVTVNVNGGGDDACTYASGSGSTALVYTLPATVDSGDTATLDYTQPGDGFEDAAGNDVVSINNQATTNNSTQGGEQNRVMNAATVNVGTLNKL